MVIGPVKREVHLPPRTVKWAFTITLSRRMRLLPAEQQYDKTRHIIDSLRFQEARVSCIAELHKSYDIHYHGIVDFRYTPNIPSYPKLLHDYFRMQPELGVMRDVKPIDDEAGWQEYILKDLEKTNLEISRFPILRDDFRLVPEGKFRLYGIQDTTDASI